MKSSLNLEMPSCNDSERGALSCILLEGNQGSGKEHSMLEKLTAADFHDLQNRRVYEALEALRKKDINLNFYEIREATKDKIDQAYLSGLLTEAASSEQFPVYLRNVRETSERRMLLGFARTTADLAQNPNLEAKEIVNDLQFEIRNVVKSNDPSKELPSIEKFDAFLDKNMPKPPELLRGVLHKGSKMLISGPSKMGKTWALLDLAISVATGKPFWGIETTKADVLYINLELQGEFTQARCRAINSAKGVKSADGCDIWNLRGHSCDITKLREQLMPQIKRKDYDLIIIDPIYKIYGGRDENSVAQIAEVMNELEAIIKDTEAALIYVTHQTKGNQASKESIDRVAGSGAFARDVDSGLILTTHEQENCFTVEAPILRNFPPFKPFVLRWDYPIMSRVDELDPQRLKESRNPNRQKEHSVEEILAHVPTDEPIDKNILREKANAAGIAINKINSLIEQAIKKEVLYEHQIKRSGTCPKKRLARFPQELEGDLHDPHDMHTLESCTPIRDTRHAHTP